ncbi:MAG: riboflavin synthase [Dehalococcoidales bacterium]
MFTGIIEETGRVTAVSPAKLIIAASRVLQGMEPGGSVNVNGACLTVTNFDAGSFSVDIMLETLNRTNLGLLRAGDKVNLERPLTLERPLGGHLVQGHIDATGRVASVTQYNETTTIRLEAPPEVMRYVVGKGFIAVDGISLTVMARDSGSFEVAIVGYTLKNTNLGSRQVGDLVNLEVDIIAKYVEQFDRGRSPAITYDFLKESGFLAS